MASSRKKKNAQRKRSTISDLKPQKNPKGGSNVLTSQHDTAKGTIRNVK